MGRLIFFLLFLQSTIALAQGEATQGGFADVFNSWPEIGKLFAFGLAIQMFLRGLAELLTRTSDWLDAKSPTKVWLQKVAAWCSELVWLLGTVLGKFGVGEPKLVTAEKIAQSKTAEVGPSE